MAGTASDRLYATRQGLSRQANPAPDGAAVDP
jgi:hypothetical protein